MRIVTLQEMFDLPDGTIFSYYEPEIAQGLFRKGETILDSEDQCPIDFMEARIIADPPTIGTPGYGKCELEVSPMEGRWALYDDTAQFAIYEPDDIEIMVEMLTGKEE